MKWVALLLTAVIYALTWVQIAPAYADLPPCHMMAYDASGFPTIAYTRLVHEEIRYAFFDGFSWTVETITIGSEYFATAHTITADGTPAVAFFDEISEEILLAQRIDGSWAIETVASASGPGGAIYQIGIANGADGSPVISFPRAAAQDQIWVAQSDGSAWVETMVASGPFLSGRTTTATVSPSGNVTVAYNVGYDFSAVVETPGGWMNLGTVPEGGSIANFGAAYSPTGMPALAYNDFGASLRYAVRQASGNWTTEVVDSSGGSFIGANTDLAFDDVGQPVISYTSNSTPDELRLATKSGATWVIEMVDTAIDTVTETSVAIAPDGTRAISYGDGNYAQSGVLKFARSPVADLDCNDNGVLDECDIADGTSQDSHNDGIPDECQSCKGDANGDGTVDPLDSGFVRARFGPCP